MSISYARFLKTGPEAGTRGRMPRDEQGENLSIALSYFLLTTIYPPVLQLKVEAARPGRQQIFASASGRPVHHWRKNKQ